MVVNECVSVSPATCISLGVMMDSARLSVAARKRGLRASRANNHHMTPTLHSFALWCNTDGKGLGQESRTKRVEERKGKEEKGKNEREEDAKEGREDGRDEK